MSSLENTEENVPSASIAESIPDEKELSFWRKNWQQIVAFLLWVAAGAGVYGYMISNDLTFSELVLQSVDLFNSPAGVLIYILVYALRPLMIFSAVVLTLVGGSVFGPVWGIPIVIVASNASAMVAYLIGRYFGEGLLAEEEDSQTVIQRYARRLRKESFATVLLMRLIFLPYDLVNYLCGLLRIDWKSYLLATAIGNIPGTISFVLAGASLDLSNGLTQPEFNPWSFVASVLLVGVSIAISRYFKAKEEPENA